LLNIRYIVIPATYASDRTDLNDLDRTFPTIYADEQVKVLENPAALPRAWIVGQARQVEADEILPLLASGGIDPRETALLETTPPPLGTTSGNASGSVRIVDDEPETMRLETQVDSPALLVLSEMDDPNWRAFGSRRRRRELPVPGRADSRWRTHRRAPL
jgi:hypothetical protein